MKNLFLFIGILIVSYSTFGQRSILKSSVDDSLSFKSIAILPIVDNTSQIYAKPLTAKLMNIVEQDRQWGIQLIEQPKNSPEDFENNPQLVKTLLSNNQSDLLLTTRLSRGPQGMSARMNLFSKADGLLLVQDSFQNYSGFEISDIEIQIANLYKKLKQKMPYTGVILSRTGQNVTVNIGSLHSIQTGQDLSIVQIIKVNRHPKFNFIVSTEKEVIGRIRLDKVEESLSFGSITLERNENIVQPMMKVIPVDFLAYDNPARGKDGKIIPGLSERPDGALIVGDQPAKEWNPQGPPTFGKVGLGFGLGSYAVNNTVNNVGAVDDTSNLNPSIHLDGELWITSNWFIGLGLKQFIVNLDNNYAGSSPGKINISALQTTIQGGYNFLLDDEFFGPKFQGLLGYSQFSAQADTSQPTALTSMNFGGLALGILGSFPVSDETPVTLGAKLLLYLNSSVSESPVSSGSSSSARITTFSAFSQYRWSERMNLKAELMYDLYTASFSGTGTRSPSASSGSHTITTLSGGVEFLF